MQVGDPTKKTIIYNVRTYLVDSACQCGTDTTTTRHIMPRMLHATCIQRRVYGGHITSVVQRSSWQPTKSGPHHRTDILERREDSKAHGEVMAQWVSTQGSGGSVSTVISQKQGR